MNIHVKITGRHYATIVEDLARPHSFAAERVGFVAARTGRLVGDDRLILVTRYHAIPDDYYIEDATVGARIGSPAMNIAMQAAYSGQKMGEGVFHIHLHPHVGETSMSSTDRREIPPMIPGFQSVGPTAAHGIIILSHNHGTCWVWLPDAESPVKATRVSIVGTPVRVFERRAQS